jgi:hypothetical protein
MIVQEESLVILADHGILMAFRVSVINNHMLTKTKRRGRSWITGPDPKRHDQYTAWLKHRSQAWYRGEEHSLTFEEWEQFWNTDWAWENRGRGVDCVNLTRIDPEKGWSKDNCYICSRHEHLVQMGYDRIGTKYKRRKK